MNKQVLSNVVKQVCMLFCIIIGCGLHATQAQVFRKKNLLTSLLKKHPEHFKDILSNPEKYRVQIIYTKINRNAQNLPSFKNYSYRLNANEYFYPASTVKLPAALVALEKINKLSIPGLTKHTPLRIDSAFTRQTPVVSDSSASNGLPSIAHYIKKIFLVSDNDAYNRLYEFIGQEQLNSTLWQKGFTDVRLLHRLSVGDTGETTRYTNPITFYNGGKVIYQQPLVHSAKNYSPKNSGTRLGKGYYNADNRLIMEPMDFADRNSISLETLHNILKSVIFPESVPLPRRFNLTPDDHDFILKYMSMKPSESRFPSYDSTTYYDTYAKFLLFGNLQKTMPPHIRIFNKIGNAYGFMIDNAYVVDFNNNVEFLLSAVVLANEDGIFNDDKYEYDKVGYPFLKNLGQIIYKHELKRSKKHLPDLSRFKFTY